MGTVLAVILKRIWAILLSMTAVFRRLICRARRGRKNSGSILPMTTDDIHMEEIQQSLPSNDTADLELESWDAWGIEDKLSHPSQLNGFPRQPDPPTPDSQPEIDFFQDMAPKIKKPTKILIRKKDDYIPTGLSSRLTMTSEVPLQNDELGAWDDGENAWAEEISEDLSWQAQAAIKEKKRLEREQRQIEQQRKKLEKEASRSGRNMPLSAVKLS